MRCFFVSDLHGRMERYQKLLDLVRRDPPDALFMGGDMLPSPFAAARGECTDYEDFIGQFLAVQLCELKQILKDKYPAVFVILGNDDGRIEEDSVLRAQDLGIWTYCHNRRVQWAEFDIYGYAFIPPSPFRLKDWEHYDVTDYVRPGCIAPDSRHGVYTVRPDGNEHRTATIEKDLEHLTRDNDDNGLARSIFLFHSPPHRSKLDRAALDGRRIDGIQVDVHVGSVAIQRFIKRRQPLLTLHGHIHESTRLTGAWCDRFDRTLCFNASHDGPELSLVRFDPHHPENAVRTLI